MARKLTQVELDDLDSKVWPMYVARVPEYRIAQQLGHNRRTIKLAIKRCYAAMAEARGKDAEQWLLDLEAACDYIQRDSSVRLSNVRDNGMNVPGLQANLLKAAELKAKARGVMMERQKVEHSGELTVINQLLDKAIEVIYPDRNDNPEGQS